FYYMSKAVVSTFGYSLSNYQLIDYSLTIEGSDFIISINKKIYNVKTKLLGLFNIYNILAFIAIIDKLKLLSNKTFEFLNSKINILGRMEVININNRYFVIDFAHTPDGVKKVLEFLNSVK